jgi:HPt (histidine-containing phosphotransfer) domain-containing protein
MSAMKSEMTGKMETEAGDGGSSVRPLDLVHLSKYTFGDRGLEAELMGLFRSQAEVYISRLETATTPKDWRDAAHSLKGSARGLGAWGLGDIAEEVERHDFADVMQRHADIARVREEIDVVKDFIDEMLS